MQSYGHPYDADPHQQPFYDQSLDLQPRYQGDQDDEEQYYEGTAPDQYEEYYDEGGYYGEHGAGFGPSGPHGPYNPMMPHRQPPPQPPQPPPPFYGAPRPMPAPHPMPHGMRPGGFMGHFDPHGAPPPPHMAGMRPAAGFEMPSRCY